MEENGKQTMLTVHEVAKHLNIGINAAYKLVKQPGFPATRMGAKRYLTSMAALERWVEEQAGKSVSLEVEG